MIAGIFIGVTIGFILSAILQNLTRGMHIFFQLKNDDRIISEQELNKNVQEYSRLYYIRDIWGYNAVVLSKKNENKVSGYMGLLANGVVLNAAFKRKGYWERKFPELIIEETSSIYF